jgi:hypothetical protein
MVQVPEPPLPPGVSEGVQLAEPTLMVADSVAGSTSWFPVVTVAVKVTPFSAP